MYELNFFQTWVIVLLIASSVLVNQQHKLNMGFPGGSVGKESACNAPDPSSIPGLGRSPEEGNGNPLQYSCLGNPMDRGASWAIVHGVAQLDMT